MGSVILCDDHWWLAWYTQWSLMNDYRKYKNHCNWWVSSQSLKAHVRLINKSKLPLGVGVDCCLSVCGPVMNWRCVCGVPSLSPNDIWDNHPHAKLIMFELNILYKLVMEVAKNPGAALGELLKSISTISENLH